MKKMPPNISEHLFLRVKEMLEYGDDDFSMALRALEGKPSLPRKACIEAHTATEKYLKAFLVFHKEPYRKYGHNLAEIINSCSAKDAAFEELKGDIRFLNKYKGEAEYPPPQPYTYMGFEEIARDTIERTKKVKAFVLERLKIAGCDISPSI